MRLVGIATIVLACACVGQTSTPAPSSAPPTVEPTPTPFYPGGQPNATGAVPKDFVRYRARLADERSGLPIVGACIYTGPPAGCPLPGSFRTDPTGSFAMDLPAGLVWEFTFEHPKYKPILRALLAPDTDALYQLQPAE